MGKKVTYFITSAGVSETARIYDELRRQIVEYRSAHKMRRAAKVAIELLEYVTNLSTEEEASEPSYKQYLQKSIKICKEHLKYVEKWVELSCSAYKALSGGYLILDDFEHAIKYGTRAIDILQRPVNHTDTNAMDEDKKYFKEHLQTAYRALGNTYFQKSLHPTEARHFDVETALQYYNQECEILDTMTKEDIEGETDENYLESLLQASSYNRGVMQCKIPRHFNEGEINLRKAIEQAKELQDPASEKRAWWELGNFYKRTKNFDLVKKCQKEEHRLIEDNGFKEEEIHCYNERMFFHLYLGEYHECLQLHENAIANKNATSSKPYDDTLRIVEKVRIAKEQFMKSLHRRNPNESLATKAIDYIELLMRNDDKELYRMALQAIDEFLPTMLKARDYSNLAYAQLLHYRTVAQWALGEFEKEDYLKSSNDAFDFVKTNLLDSALKQLGLLVEILELRVKIYEFFDHEFQMQATKSMLEETMKEERLMRQKQENSYNLIKDYAEYNRITPSIFQMTKRSVRVKILVEPPVELTIHYQNVPETVKKLMEDIAKRCWDTYGLEPIIKTMYTKDNEIFPQDYLKNVIVEDNQFFEAAVKSMVNKKPLQIYENTCKRLKTKPLVPLRLALTEQTIRELSFASLYNIPDQLPVIQQVIEKCYILHSLNLSSNMLEDEDIAMLLKSANPGLGELQLANNRLTSNCLLSVEQFLQLRSVNLSYNDLGPSLFHRLHHFLQKIRSLRYVDLEHTSIGKEMDIDDALTESYQVYSNKVLNAANLTLNIGNNHFENDMLSRLTALFLCINRISRLELSSISSDAGWINFEQLSGLPKLGELSLRYTNRQTLDYCHFAPFFDTKRTLTHLDFTSCGLNVDDMVVLSSSLEHLLKLKKLTLDSNPLIGVDGLKYLNGIVENSKIDMLEIASCGVTKEGFPLIIRWITRLRSIDVSRNQELRLTQEDLDRLTNILNEEAIPRRVILDDFRRDLPSKDLKPIFGLSFNTSSQLPDSPFSQ